MSRLTFFTDKKLHCPACSGEVKVEIMRQGGGRLNSSGLENDLRRTYVSRKDSELVCPIIHSILVCGKCWFAALEDDFDGKNFDMFMINDMQEQRRSRGKILLKNQDVDFNKYRDLKAGLLSYYLAIHCYNYYHHKQVIDFYKGMFALRGSWCARDLAISEGDSDFFYTALYLRYLSALNYENFVSANEMKTINENITYYGPDTDHDFGFKGMIYLSSFLGEEFSELISDDHDRYIFYTKLLRRLSRVFGVGKRDKSAPSLFLDKVYDIYNRIKEKTDGFQDGEKESMADLEGA